MPSTVGPHGPDLPSTSPISARPSMVESVHDSAVIFDDLASTDVASQQSDEELAKRRVVPAGRFPTDTLAPGILPGANLLPTGPPCRVVSTAPWLTPLQPMARRAARRGHRRDEPAPPSDGRPHRRIATHQPTTARGRQIAAYDTRASKDTAVDHDALRPSWERRLADVGFDHPAVERCSGRPRGPAVVTDDERREQFNLMAHRSVCRSRHPVLGRLHREGGGVLSGARPHRTR